MYRLFTDVNVSIHKDVLRIKRKENLPMVKEKDGVLILVNYLYAEGLLNEKTYQNIMKKYKCDCLLG